VIELDPMIDEYYGERAWDLETGKPTAEKLKRLGLDRASADLSKI